MIKDILFNIIFYSVIALVVVGFIYTYSQDSYSTRDECVPDYMTGDCSF